MSYHKLSIITPIIPIFIIFHLLGFNVGKCQQLELYNEPDYTQNRRNIIYLKTCANIEQNIIEYWVIDENGEEHYIQDSDTSIKAIEIAIIKGDSLQDGPNYKYYAKAGTTQSPKIQSIQDSTPPEVSQEGIHFKNSVRDNWYNHYDNIIVQPIIVDPAGIDSIALIYRLAGTKDTTQMPYKNPAYEIGEFGAAPENTRLAHPFELKRGIASDGQYDIYIYARDAAHKPESHGENKGDSTWQLGGNEYNGYEEGKKIGHIRIDTIKPTSKITAPDSPIIVSQYQDITFNFSANDPPQPGTNFNSGLDSVILMYDYKATRATTERITGRADSFHCGSTDSGFGYREKLEGTMSFNPKKEYGDGIYYFYTIAKDCAGNIQDMPPDNQKLKVIVDTNSPIIQEFFVKDTTKAPSEFETFAKDHWTNDMTVQVKLKGVDLVAGADSVFFTIMSEKGNSKILKYDLMQKIESDSFSIDSLFIDLLDVGWNFITCEVKDCAGKISASEKFEIRYYIIGEFMMVDSIVIEDEDGGSTTITNSPQVNINVYINTHNLWYKNIAGIYFYDSLMISNPNTGNPDWHERDALKRVFIPNAIQYSFKFSPEYHDTDGWLICYCVIQDSAGTIRPTVWAVKDSIDYKRRLEISHFRLSDVTPEDASDAADSSWSDSLVVSFAIEGLPNYVGESAFLHFSLDSNFLENLDSINYYDSTFNTAAGTGVFDLTKIGLSRDTCLRNTAVWIRLHSISMDTMSNDTSAIINFDFENPSITRFELIDTIPNAEYEILADSLWTNDLEVQSIIDADDICSGLWKLRFNGEVADTNWQEYPLKSHTISLTPEEGAKQVTVQIKDKAGNISNETYPITFDQTPPALIVPDQIPCNRTDFISIPINLSDYFMLWKLWLWSDPSYSKWETILDTNNLQIKIDFPCSELAMDSIIYILASDRAGNVITKQTRVVPDRFEISIQLFDGTDTLDSEFTSTPDVMIKITIKSNHEIITSRCVSQKPDFYDTDWKPDESKRFIFTLDTTGVGDGIYTLYVQCRANDNNLESNIAQAQIKLDTKIPLINSVSSLDGKTICGISTEDLDFKVHAFDPYPGQIESLYVAIIENDCAIDSQGFSWAEDTVYTYPNLFERKGKKQLNFRVTDFAEHSSTGKSEIVYYDPHFEAEGVYNYPNPFNPLQVVTEIVIHTTGTHLIKARIYDIFGNEINRWDDIPANNQVQQRISWDGKTKDGRLVADGAYYCIVDAGYGRKKTIIVVKKR